MNNAHFGGSIQAAVDNFRENHVNITYQGNNFGLFHVDQVTAWKVGESDIFLRFVFSVWSPCDLISCYIMEIWLIIVCLLSIISIIFLSLMLCVTTCVT